MHRTSHTYIYAVCERDGLIESSFHKIIPLNSNHNMTVACHAIDPCMWQDLDGHPVYPSRLSVLHPNI